MTIVINKKWLRELWAPVGGHDDWDDSPWKNSDILDEVVLQRLIEDELVPEYTRAPQHEQMRIKETFRYALNFYSSADLLDIFSSCLPPFSIPPRRIRRVYQDIWNGMFNGEEWTIVDKATYHDLRNPRICISTEL